LTSGLMSLASKIAEQEKLTNGFRVVLNTGLEGGQSVFHVHAHVLGGRSLTWPPG
jgi:histidine triad (HIT) family protein